MSCLVTIKLPANSMRKMTTYIKLQAASAELNAARPATITNIMFEPLGYKYRITFAREEDAFMFKMQNDFEYE